LIFTAPDGLNARKYAKHMTLTCAFRVSVKQSNRSNTDSDCSFLELADTHLVLPVYNGNVTDYNIFLLFLVGWYCGHYWPIVPAPDDDGDCGAIGGMKIGRESRSTRRKPHPVPLSRPQIPHDLTRARTRADAGGSQRLTA
jgi:hypothetical protein